MKEAFRNQISQKIQEGFRHLIQSFEDIRWKKIHQFFKILILQPRFRTGFLIFSTFWMASLTAQILVLFLGKLIPQAKERFPSPEIGQFGKLVPSYDVIFSRNLFSSLGFIPGDESAKKGIDPGGTPTKTSLPLNLLGILHMSFEERSIATLEYKPLSEVFPMRQDDEIADILKILRIEPERVIFLNLVSGKREFIEMDVSDVKFFDKGLSSQNNKKRPIKVDQVSPTQFNIPRSQVDSALADINSILTQARAVPNSDGGVTKGYKLFQIVPGSIYDKLGLQNGDVILGLNGQSINDPSKAFELISELKTANHVELQIEKDGKPTTYSYDISSN